MLPLGPLLAALSATPAPASAVEQLQPRPAPRVPDTRILGGAGVSAGDTHGGIGLTAYGAHRFSVLTLGLELNTSFAFSAMVGVGLVGGLYLGDDFSVSLLGAGGIHYYDGVGSRFLSDDPGVSGSTPYVGGRVVVAYRWPIKKQAHRPFIGTLAGLDHDLREQDKSVTYQSSDFIFGGTSEQTSTHHLGQISYTGLIVVGVELDLAPY